MKKAKTILSDNKPKLDEIAKVLYEKETLTGSEMMELLAE